MPDSAISIALGPIKREGVGFGLGFSVRVGRTPLVPDRALGEYRWGGMASTQFWIAPHDALIVIALQQHLAFSPVPEMTIKPLVYDAIVE